MLSKFYRNITKEYNPIEKYDFDSWRDKLDNKVKDSYERLIENFLYSNQKQDFRLAINTFSEINRIFISIEE